MACSDPPHTVQSAKVLFRRAPNAGSKSRLNKPGAAIRGTAGQCYPTTHSERKLCPRHQEV